MSGKPALRPPRGPWAAAVMVWLVALRAPVAEGRDAPRDFVLQYKALCYFTNGTERVRFLVRFIYNQEEYMRYDSEVGEFRAMTPLGRPTAQYKNSQKDLLERNRAYVDTLCRHNYPIGEARTLHQRGEHPVRPPPPDQSSALGGAASGTQLPPLKGQGVQKGGRDRGGD
ncbi:hypothetical protein QTO34_012965 [Cnephaeus nilssonii]|uniref:MHC class II beta chain N-terminal domain-containing protein n=1 Tax=Cnephaeus nilssonii TaxID=3371016 RepID=A0AA40LDF5_CNENI|nr:hypothetical protein QTO34_012965 [Eptesicus nilssonii]